MIAISAKAKWNLKQILPFGIIWLILGWIFLTVEYAATGNQVNQPDTAIRLNFAVLVFASVAVFIVGVLIGVFEVIFFKNLFKKEKFAIQLIAKLFVYSAALTLIIILTYPLAASLESNVPIYDGAVWIRLASFLGSIVFLSTVLQMAFSLFLCLVYYGISQHLGHGALINFFTGKYNQPLLEERMFMFVDIKDSTTIAEKLGSKKYYALLSDYYDTFSQHIIDNYGEVYQYIGDEVVITWELKKGLKENHAIRCFYEMKKGLLNRQVYFEEEYGFLPAFKAALHYGHVTTGEIGALKKEIFFTGDVLNVTSRIQDLCNQYKEELLISKDFFSVLQQMDPYTFTKLGEVILKGRKQPIGLLAVHD